MMAGRSPLSQVLHANFASYLADDLLVKTDRCTMANSLEARSPFLDRELVEYVGGAARRSEAARPPDQGHTARRVRRSGAAGRSSAAARWASACRSDTWFRGELRDYMRDLLLAPGARYREMLSGAFVEGLVARHLAGAANLGQPLWSIMCFETWLRAAAGVDAPRDDIVSTAARIAERFAGRACLIS